MVLTECILTALHILIEQIARLLVDAEGGHGDGREHTGSAAMESHLIDLWKLGTGKDVRLCRGHRIGAEKHVVVVLKCQGKFGAAVCG